MSLISSTIAAAERAPLPDVLIRAGISALLWRTATRLADAGEQSDTAFAKAMAARAIAEETGAANTQHYEVPAAFFARVLGPHRKYSSGFYVDGTTTLGEAEEEALRQTVAMPVLLMVRIFWSLDAAGARCPCGWRGSFRMRGSRLFPTRIPSANILSDGSPRGLRNLQVVTSDMNAFEPRANFSRIVSVEMFEHMMNWRELLTRARSWLAADGRLFLHIFSHRTGAYLFDRNNREDWIAQHFFTGGVMPSHQLIRQYADLFEVEQEWRWNGTHYQRTADGWLRNFDAARDDIERVLAPVYGEQTKLWMRRWRWFFLATSGLFGHAEGSEWGVSHYRLRRA
jgi:cyclopropane-fatty-acyl-phospholipid synthase